MKDRTAQNDFPTETLGTMQRIVERGRMKWFDQFDPSDLRPEFAPFLHTGQRIAVTIAGEVWTGTVGITTGWRPAFLLMPQRNSTGSSNLLTDATLLAVHDGRLYRDAQARRVILRRSEDTSIGAYVAEVSR